MKDEASPVTPDELVLRLIWHEFYTPHRAVAVRARAFQPRPNEPDGISVFRVACLGDPADALAVMAPEKRDKYALVVLPVAELADVGVTVQPVKIEGVPGHAVLPELNALAIADDGPRWEAVQKQLAEIASRNIVRPPTPPEP